MAYKICYWDSELQAQSERDTTEEETNEIDIRRAESNDPSQKRSTLIKEIDVDVDAIYAAAIGNRASEYELAESDAKTFMADRYSGDVPSSVQSWADAKGESTEWAADNIIATSIGWRRAQAAIRENRLKHKEAARRASDMDALLSIRASWGSFVLIVRSQIGI